MRAETNRSGISSGRKVKPSRKGTAIVAISRRGREQALRLHGAMEGCELYFLHGALSPDDQAPSGAPPETPSRVIPYRGRLRDLIGQVFPRTQALVIFSAVGMAVRLIAPHLVSKRTDPAVVVVDEHGRYAISLLSGHLGGANRLAMRVASILGGEPIITTASDLADTIAVDLLGQEHGWHIENVEHVTAVSAALVNGLRVGLYQDAGERDWWPRGKPLPTTVERCSALEQLASGRYMAALVITDRLVEESALPARAVVYRPRSLVVGVGCNRGTSVDEIAEAVDSTLREHGLSLASVRLLATIDLKRDEAGLTQCAARLGVPLVFFSPAELATIQNLPHPSPMVHGHVGSPGVCEPAALLAARATRLEIPKTRKGNATVAVARIEEL